MPEEEVNRLNKLDYMSGYYAGYRNGVALHWHTINTMPKEDTQIMACTADGRVMIWSSDMLRRVMSGKQPFHLQFPATHWMLLPATPASN
jgi:hypothetical protein